MSIPSYLPINAGGDWRASCKAACARSSFTLLRRVTNMPTPKGTRRSLLLRTLERCKSGPGRSGGAASAVAGCFSVYVGTERERFMVRTDCANHPLFRRLLDDAEREYGYASQGPLALPCDVGTFLDVLWQMDHGVDEDDDGGSAGRDELPTAARSPVCGLLLGSRSKCRAAGYGKMLGRARSTSAAGQQLLPGFTLGC
ncbi:Auxin-responsive protein SAUR41 [Hordeum vulgare]|nr:Auxin-responsive protein SAUR41 [Hordeum vulgare]